jgi:hypothetical protein
MQVVAADRDMGTAGIDPMQPGDAAARAGAVDIEADDVDKIAAIVPCGAVGRPGWRHDPGTPAHGRNKMDTGRCGAAGGGLEAARIAAGRDVDDRTGQDRAGRARDRLERQCCAAGLASEPLLAT